MDPRNRKLTVAGVVDAAKAWKRFGVVNVVLIERGKEGVTLKVNDEVITTVPLAAARSTYSRVSLGLQYNLKGFRAKSPRIHSIRLVPLEAAD
jgi:hypothetical protein